LAEKLEIVILAKDQASKALGSVSGALGDFGSKAGKIAAVGLAGAAAGITAVGVASIALARDAAPLQGVQDAFNGIAEAAGVGGDEMLAALQKGSEGMITNRDLMMSFNKASQLVGEDFAKKLPDAMGFLGKVAQATGEDMGFMMDSLVTGVGRLSPMILDNLGIQVTLADATAAAAEQFGVEASELSKAQIQAGMMDVVLEKLADNTAAMPDIAGSAAQAFSSFETTLANTKDQIGLALLPAILPLMEKLGELASDALPAIIESITPVIEIFGRFFEGIVSGEDPLGDMYNLIWELGQLFGLTSEEAAGFAEGFQNIATTISEFVTGTLVPFVQEHWETFKQGLIAVGAILAGGLIITGITTLIGLITAIISPIGLIVLAIAALAMAWQNNWGGIQEKTAAVLAWLQTTISSVLTAIQAFWTAHGEQIMTTLQMAWDAILSIIESVTSIIMTIVQAVAQFIQEIWQKHGAEITAYLESLWNTIVTVFQSAITIVQNIFAAFANLLKGDWQALGDNLKAIWDALWTAIKAIFETAKANLTLTINILKTVLGNITQQISDKLGDIWDKAWAYIQGLFETAKTTLQGIANDIVDRIKGAFEIDWGALGSSIIDGIIGAVNNGVGRLANAAKNAARKAFNAFMNFLKGKSPSKLFAEAGESIIQGVELGIGSELPFVEEAMRKAGEGLYSVFGDSMLTNNPILIGTWHDMWTGMSQLSDDTLLSMGAGYSDFFDIMGDTFRDGYVTIQGETLQLSDYLITSGKATRDEVVDIYREMGLALVNVTDGTTGQIHHIYADAFDGMTNITADMWNQVVTDFINNGFQVKKSVDDTAKALPSIWNWHAQDLKAVVDDSLQDIQIDFDTTGMATTNSWDTTLTTLIDLTTAFADGLRDLLGDQLADTRNHFDDMNDAADNFKRAFYPDLFDLPVPIGPAPADNPFAQPPPPPTNPGDIDPLQPGYYDSDGNWVPITDYTPQPIGNDAGAGTNILPNTPYPSDESNFTQSVTITGGITVVEPTDKEDFVEELSKLLT
jgi:phage-related protein